MNFLLSLSFLIATLTVVMGLTDLESGVIGSETVVETCEAAALGDYTFQVLIKFETIYGSRYCSGALIDEQWVITAAHCCEGAVEAYVIAGVVAVYSGDNYPYKAGRIIQHESYNRLTHDHNIGLIYLEKAITRNDRISFALIPNTEIEITYNFEITSWISVDNNAHRLFSRQVSAARKYPCSTASVTLDNVICYDTNSLQEQCIGDPADIASYKDGINQYASCIKSKSLVTGVVVYTKTSPYRNWLQTITGKTL